MSQLVQTIKKSEVENFIEIQLKSFYDAGFIYQAVVKENELIFYSAWPQKLVEFRFQIIGDNNETVTVT